MGRFPILAELKAGTKQRHLIRLPGAALANDEPRPVISITGSKPGPVLFVNAGVHGGEYPAIEAVIRLSKKLEPKKISGTVILMPVLSLPSFRTRTPFVCPIDNVNPNRVFPGDATGSYSEQMTHALINEFVVYADAYIDLHGGDIPEALVPFVICRAGVESEAKRAADVARKSKEIAMAFGLPYVLTISKPVQPAKGHPAGAGGLSSYAAGGDRDVPSILAEAGGVGQLQEEAVELLVTGVRNVMTHLGMLPENLRLQIGGLTIGGRKKPEVLTKFEWLYTKRAGMWYPKIAPGDSVKKAQKIGRVGDLFGDTLEKIISPVDGVVLFLTINPSVLENGLLMGIGVR